MEFKKFCEEHSRMCKHYSINHDEKNCPLRSIAAYCCYCQYACMKDPDMAENIVVKWKSEHPCQTMLSVVKEKFPSIALNEKGVPMVCPQHLCDAWSNSENGGCVLISGSKYASNCVACWTRPVPDDEE